MSTLVVNRDSISVKLESEHLVVHDHAKESSFQRVPLVDVDRVVVVGNPAISFHVLAKLMDRGVACSFMTHAGKWRGVIDGDSGYHGTRRILQYERASDASFALELSRRLVAAKIANSRRTIQRLAAERDLSLDDDVSWIRLSSCTGSLVHAESLDVVRGIEGGAANAYFAILSRFFPKDAPFPLRSRRPPRDAANALLSFAYTLLTNEFESSIRSHGLDVAAGFFHRKSDRAPALALDLMEPFRASWTDRLVLGLLNHRRIRASDHFTHSDFDGVHLNEEGRKIFFRAFDDMMMRRQMTNEGGMTLRGIVDKAVCQYIKVLESDAETDFYKAA